MSKLLNGYFNFAENATWQQKLFIVAQYLLPQHCVSRLVGRLAACEAPWLKNFLIEKFIKQFKVNMSEAAQPDYRYYRNFNEFFTRPLAEGQRTICAEGVASPADGAVSQCGDIEAGRVFQAKGQSYTVLELLGGDRELAHAFEDGEFATIYLSPKDYHRVHMPLTGKLLKSIYVPGELFSVNQATAENVPRLFSRNERLVAIFETEKGKMAVVLVGAMIVAGIETVYAGQVAPPPKTIQVTDYEAPLAEVVLEKGAELGRFKLGSTAIVLFEKSANVDWEVDAGDSVRMGQQIAEFD